MKEIVLVLLGSIIVIALMGGGGIQTDLSPNLEFQPKIGYMPDNRVISVDTMQQIDTNIENQIILVNPNQGLTYQSQTPGVTLLPDGPTNLCTPLPGETIYQGPDIKGACFVQDQAGNKFFLNAAGSRWPLVNHQPTPEPVLDPRSLTLEQLEKAYLDAGGTLPWSWGTTASDVQKEWLIQKLEGQ